MFPNKMKIKTLEHPKTNGSFGVFGSEESPDRLAYQPVIFSFSLGTNPSANRLVCFFFGTLVLLLCGPKIFRMGRPWKNQSVCPG
jgi:hypothetical protein